MAAINPLIDVSLQTCHCKNRLSWMFLFIFIVCFVFTLQRMCEKLAFVNDLGLLVAFRQATEKGFYGKEAETTGSTSGESLF